MKLGLIPGVAGEALAADWDGTLERLKSMGYAGVELAMGTLEQSGMSAGECRKSLDRHGLEAMSFFAGWGPFDREPEKHIDAATALGCDYMVWGWSPADDPERMQEVLPVMHKAASMVRAAGMSLLYHNHDHEFLASRGDGTAFDWLMSRFHPELLRCELDIGWVRYGGEDVVGTIEKHSGRCPILHMRDVGDPETRGAFIEVGEGVLDLEAIVKAGIQSGGSRWAIVEHGRKLPRDGFEGLGVAAENIRAAIERVRR
jgi:sugar phosphate isomerase/epimerase